MPTSATSVAVEAPAAVAAVPAAEPVSAANAVPTVPAHLLPEDAKGLVFGEPALCGDAAPTVRLRVHMSVPEQTKSPMHAT